MCSMFNKTGYYKLPTKIGTQNDTSSRQPIWSYSTPPIITFDQKIVMGEIFRSGGIAQWSFMADKKFARVIACGQFDFISNRSYSINEKLIHHKMIPHTCPQIRGIKKGREERSAEEKETKKRHFENSWSWNLDDR